MDDHKTKSNKKKTKKHRHSHEANGTNGKKDSIHGSNRKIHLKPPHFDGAVRNHETFTTNGRIRETGQYELDVIVKARAFSFNPATNSYIMKLENVRLLAENTSSHPEWLIFEIPPSKIHKTSQTQLLHEDDIDAILDEIEENEPRQHSHNHSPIHRERGHHEYNRSLSYSQKRHQIKEDHLREESKQQIPTIQETHNHNHKQHQHSEHYNKLDSLRSIPPIPSLTGGKSPTNGNDPNLNKRSFHKYRRDEHIMVNKQKMDRKKYELQSEWKRIEMEHKSHQQTACVEGARSIRNCICIERIKFMLFYYAKWVKIRTRNTSNKEAKEREDANGGDDITITNNINDIMMYYDSMSGFFEDLGYSSVAMNDDFEHIRSHHINNNSSLLFDDGEMDHQNATEELDSVSQKRGQMRGKETKKNRRDKHETMEYFGIVLGSCDAKKCNILLRHCRDRDAIDNLEEMKRRKLFFCSGSRSSGGGDKKEDSDEDTDQREIYFETKMDIIHCALLHQQTNVMLLNKRKFMTEIVAQSGSSNEDMTIRLNSQGKVNKSKMSPFGESITYWDPKHHLYCATKYGNLKEELLSNTLYSISRDLFASIGIFCSAFLNSRRGLLCCVKREHDWMKSFKMFCGYRITMDHCIALYCYTNLSVLRSVFVRNGYRHYFNHETVLPDELGALHSEIAHWSRLLLECVHCFGAPFNEFWRYYHGINCKLLFDRFNIMIDIPSSLTLDKDFAYTFSSSGGAGAQGGQSNANDNEIVGGIMVELNHGTLSDLQSLCFDNSVLSEFPLEEERFIFHSYVSVKDIVINGLHHDQWLKIFGFWYKLKEGFFFDHLIGTHQGGITKNDQLCICAMIINMMLGAQNKENNKYDQRIPYYMQCLFNECIQNKAFVWIIDSEYTHLAPKLKSLLFYNTHNLNKSSQFIRYLVTQKKCNVQKCQTFKWQIVDKQFESLLYQNNIWIKSKQYKIYLYFNKNYNVTHCLSFHFQVQDKPKNGLFRCRIHLDSFPKSIHKINLGVGIYVDKINVDNYSYAEIQTDKKLYNSSLHSLFKTKLLRKYHALNLKLQIQLFYLYDQNGKIIKFQPI